MKLGTKKTVDHTDGYFNGLVEFYGISYPPSRYLFSSLFVLVYFLLQPLLFFWSCLIFQILFYHSLSHSCQRPWEI